MNENKINIPKDVYSKDEILAGSELDYEPLGGSDKEEANYSHEESPTAKEFTEANERKLENFEYSRTRLAGIGRKVNKLVLTFGKAA